MTLLLTFYGDDFTGSTDALEGLALNGVPTALFFDPPTPEQLTGRFANLRALGIAGISRSLPVEDMDAELRPKFTALKALGAPLTHYKVCSTFDSSPQIGSIGRATDIGYEVFNPPVVPLMVGAPNLKRYVAFGNLFATVGDMTFRIDRHPTMSKHPVTPMHEADLRLHLSQQTAWPIALIDMRHLSEGDEAVAARFDALVKNGAEIVLFDTLDESHLLTIGRLLWSLRGERPVFIVGSSGVEYALTAYWHEAGIIDKPPPLPPAQPVEQIIVMSGSASPVSAEQMDWAEANGFCTIRLDSAGLVESSDSAREAVLDPPLQALGEGRSVVLYSAHGPDDPAIASTRALGSNTGAKLATQQGLILRALLEQMPQLRRVCVAGGDTCSHAVRQLDIAALEVVAPLAPGGPLCRASGQAFDGLEIVLKGGQVGKADFYGTVLRGR